MYYVLSLPSRLFVLQLALYNNDRPMHEMTKKTPMFITKIAKQIRAKIMNILSFSAETWRTVFEFASIAGAVIALVSGALSVGSLIGIAITDRVIKRHDAEETRQRTIKLLTVEKETADAKRKLLETQERMRPRVFAVEAFANALKGKASGSVMIRYDPNALDAYEHVGMIMQGALEGAGWRIINPMLPAEPRPPDRIRPGITIEGLEDTTDCETRDTPSCSLWRAFKVSGLEPFQGIGGTEMAAADLPKGVFCIVIGPRPLLDRDPARK